MTPETLAEFLCAEKCAQAGDPPCSRVSDDPHCDECIGMAKAVLSKTEEPQDNGLAARPEGCVGDMPPERIIYFLERFKREEKWLGPHEQWAINSAIAALSRPDPATLEMRSIREFVNGCTCQSDRETIVAYCDRALAQGGE